MQNQVVSREEWLKARLELLAAEKEFTRQRNALPCRRMAMPWERVEKSYRFEGPNGALSLADLFDGCSQLIVYHSRLGGRVQAMLNGIRNPSQSSRCDFYSRFTRRSLTRCQSPLPSRQIALESVARILDRLGRDEERGHRALVIADTLSDQQAALDPRFVIDVICRITMNEVGSARDGSIHVVVEDQAKAAAGPGNRPQHVETFFEQADPARDKALLSH